MLTGVIPKEKLTLFERLVYRTTRGNSVMRSDEINTPFYNTHTNESVYKCVFVIYFSAARLRDKLKRLAEVNAATLHSYAENENQASGMRDSLLNQV